MPEHIRDSEYRKIERTVRELVSRLVRKDYDSIEILTAGVRLSSKHIRSAVEDYGRTLVEPPEAAFAAINVIRVLSCNPIRWSVRFDLWTVEEGRSDLTLECSLEESSSEFLKCELDDLHVL